MQSKHGSSEVFISLTAKLVPASLLCTRACHNTFVQMLHVEQNTVSHFYNARNGWGKLVGWNILKVEDVNITSADVCFSVRNTDTWDQITAWHGQLQGSMPRLNWLGKMYFCILCFGGKLFDMFHINISDKLSWTANHVGFYQWVTSHAHRKNYTVILYDWFVVMVHVI